MVYIIDNTDYEVVNGNLRFLPKLVGDWEIPTSGLHCFGSSCELILMVMNGYYSAHIIWIQVIL